MTLCDLGAAVRLLEAAGKKKGKKKGQAYYLDKIATATIALLRKSTWGTSGGHVLWALLTVWWTIGFGNLAYALITHYTAEQVMLKLAEG